VGKKYCFSGKKTIFDFFSKDASILSNFLYEIEALPFQLLLV